MKSHLHPWLLTTATALVVTVLPAQDSGAGSFDGNLRVGYRNVNVDSSGSAAKYDQHYQLSSGLRLIHLSGRFRPRGPMGRLVDKVEIEARNLGGDPLETASIVAEKRGLYTFRFDRRQSVYSYDDLLLRESESDPAARNVGDLHRFDFRRTIENATLEILPGGRLGMQLGWNRNSRSGEGTTTVELESDNFLLDKKLDDTGTDIYLALKLKLPRLSLEWEERRRAYTDDGFQSLSLPSPGIDTLNSAALNFYRLGAPLESNSSRHSLRLTGKPLSRLMMTGTLSLEMMDLDFSSTEQIDGVTTMGDTLHQDIATVGAHSREIISGSGSASYYLNDRISIYGLVRGHGFDQVGATDSLGTYWRYRSTGGKAGIRFRLSPRMTISGGVKFEERQLELAGGAEDDTLRIAGDLRPNSGRGAFTDIEWRLSRQTRIGVGLQTGSYSHPYTSTSKSDYLRFRLRGQVKGKRRWALKGVYRLHAIENGKSGWNSVNHRLSINATYSRKSIKAAVGTGYTSVNNSITNILTSPLPNGEYLPPYPQLAHIAKYSGSTLMLTGNLRWTATKWLAFGGDFMVHRTLGTKEDWTHDDGRASFWPLSRSDADLYADVNLLSSYQLRASYRYLAYEEKLQHLNDYSAGLYEISASYQW